MRAADATMFRTLLVACLLAMANDAIRAQQQPADDPPTATPTAAESKALPELGPPAALPEGAPPHLALVTRDRLRAHAYWLADDARKGRYTGSAAQKEAAAYVQKQFQALGLQPLGDKKTFVQTYPLEATTLHASSSITLAGYECKEFAVLPAGDGKFAAQGKITFCGKGRPDEIPASLEGRIPVVVLEKQPRGNGPGGDLQAIQRYGDLAKRIAKASAPCAIVLLAGDPGAFGNTLNYYGLMPDHAQLSAGGGARAQSLPIPLIALGGEHAAKAMAALSIEIKDGEPVRAHEDDKATGKVSLRIDRTQKGSATNVCAVLQGTTRKQEAIVISAHHDHIGRRIDGDAFNGADDNASGTAGLLALAEAFSKGGPRPERSIVFLSVSGEELGLWGSKHYSEHPTWPLDRIVANINIDMIGRAEKDGSGCKIQITPSKDHPKYSSLGRLAAQIAPKFEVSFTSGDAYYERSDHYNFAVKGVPVVFLCDGEHPDYHQVTDHADALDYANMERIARLLCWTGWSVANQKERPKELGAQQDW
jgi:hypothetical protein